MQIYGFLCQPVVFGQTFSVVQLFVSLQGCLGLRVGRGQVMNRIQFLGIDGLQRVELIELHRGRFAFYTKEGFGYRFTLFGARSNIVFLYLEVRGGKLLLRATGHLCKVSPGIDLRFNNGAIVGATRGSRGGHLIRCQAGELPFHAISNRFIQCGELFRDPLCVGSFYSPPALLDR